MRTPALPTPARPRLVVGLMSGTSMDGVDGALVRFAPDQGGCGVSLVSYLQVPYPAATRRRLLAMADPDRARVEALPALDREVAARFAAAARALCRQAGIRPRELLCVASHGQTIWHDPPRPGHPRGGTLQLGRGADLAARLGTWVVNDFRAADVAAGGQGAPLVPVVDALLYGNAQEPRITLNLGGVANLTALAPGDPPQVVAAFDTGPANLLLDSLVAEGSGGALAMDAEGRLAAAGRVHPEVLADLEADPFFRLPPPRTTGREAWGRPRARALRAAWPGLSLEDWAATATALTARTVAQAIRRWLPKAFHAARVLVAGGGADNPELMRRLREALAPAPVDPIEAVGGHRAAREAVAFAVLGYLFLAGVPGNAPAATGARWPCLSGTLTPPPRLRGPLSWPQP